MSHLVRAKCNHLVRLSIRSSVRLLHVHLFKSNLSAVIARNA